MAACECLPFAEKMCEATKAGVPKSQSASSADGVATRRTLVDVHRESSKAKRLSSYCARREASSPLWVAASTVPWHVRHGLNPPRASWI